MKKVLHLFVLLVFLKPTLAYAGLDNLIKYAVPESGMYNINSPGVIKDQMGGYLTGGSILLRGPQPAELQPLIVQPPKLKYDACTGSGDFRFGSLSYISAREFSNFLKSVARASGAYLLKMSIKSACPQCEDIMTYLETVARDINSLMLNQCSLAQNIAGGTLGKLVSRDRQHCMMSSNIANDKTDMFESTKYCQDHAGTSTKSESPEMHSLLGDNFNLVWKALGKGMQTDSGFKEMLMSISGTIIGTKDAEGRYKFMHHPSLIENEHLLERYIGSGAGSSKIKLYNCDENISCLSPKMTEVTLPQHETLYGNISRIMHSLISKVRADNPKLSDDEEALLSFSSIPLLNLIEMELSSKARAEDLLIRMSEFIEVVCYDVITNYLGIMLSKTVKNVESLEYAQLDDAVIRKFTDNAAGIRKFLTDAKFLAFQKLQVITQVKERLKLQEKEFEFRFMRIMENVKG